MSASIFDGKPNLVDEMSSLILQRAKEIAREDSTTLQFGIKQATIDYIEAAYMTVIGVYDEDNSASHYDLIHDNVFGMYSQLYKEW